MRTSLSSGTPVEIVGVNADDPDQRGLVIVPDIWGLRPLFVEMCESVAARTGWAVACFETFPGKDLPGSDAPDGLAARGAELALTDDARVLSDAVESARLTEAADVALIGFCMGGMYALKSSSTRAFDRVVSFYGMAHVQDTWSGPGQGDPIALLAERGETKVMELVGTEDIFVPEAHITDLENAGVEVHRYVGAEHGFVHDPSRPAHRPDDATDAWTRALEFISR